MTIITIQNTIQNITRKTFSFNNHAESEIGRLVPYLFLFFKKVLYEVKANMKL